MIATHLLFFFAGLGAFNGLALAVVLLWRPPRTPAQRWLAVLVLMLSLRTGKSVLLVFWPEVSRSILQAGLTACLLIGPCLLAFVRAWADPARLRSHHDWMMVATLLAIAVVLGVAFPYAAHPDWWGARVGRLVSAVWLVCLLVATRVCHQSWRAGQPSMADGLRGGHVAAVIAGAAVVWLAYFTAGLTSYIVGALSFSMVLYLGVIAWLARRSAPAGAAQRDQDRRIPPEQAQAGLQSLHRLMVEEALFKDAGLNLARVARRLQMPAARVSQLLNDNNRTTFRQYLNQLRVDAARQRLRTPGPLLMEQVAEEAGFLSMSTFYSAFKKAEGTTPAAWRQVQLARPDS